MIKCVIFDLDGVIVSTDNLHFEAWKKMCDLEGIRFDGSINNRLRGISRMESLQIILENASKEYSQKEMKELTSFKNDIYVKSLANLSEKDILSGILELLGKLREKRFKLAIGSSSKNALAILNQIGLIEYFDAISDGTSITMSKPHPEVFLNAAKMCCVKPSECVVVEDAVSGILAAKAAGMISFAFGDAKKSKFKDYDLNQIFDVLELGGVNYE